LERKVIYDVGAHCGNDTAQYLSLGYRVVAIEADPALCSDLRNRFSREIDAGNVTVLNFGIAERDGELPFYLCSANSESNSAGPNWARKHARRFVRAHPRVKKLVSSIRPRPRAEPGHIGSSSGPVPMLRDEGWQDLNSFVYTWTNIVESGQLLTTWYDIHVTR
jgi:FkbM family methyltransferase